MMTVGAATYLLELPKIEYHHAHKLQVSLVHARYCGRLANDLVIMLEHPPVYTLGRRGGQDNLLVTREWLETRGIEIVPIERGGDITYHGPGQLVVYALMDLKSKDIGVAGFISRLETAMVETASYWGVIARGDDTHRGAWIGRRKLGSVGITVRRGVTFHGLALNVNIDLEPFQWINPCGLKSCEMTSLEIEAGQPIAMADVRQQMAAHLESVFDMELTPVGLDEIDPYLGDVG